MVLYVHKPLPCGLATERVIVVLHETVHEVYSTESVLYPFYIVFVPELQVPCTVIFDKCRDVLPLQVALGHHCRLLQFGHYLLKGSGIDSPDPVDILPDHSVSTFHHLAVQPVGHRVRVRRVRHVMVVFLNLCTGHIVIEVHGGQGDDIPVGVVGLPLRIDVRIIYHRQQLVGLADSCSLHQGTEIFLRTVREELVLSIVVMDAVAEEHPFSIYSKILEIFAVPVPVIIFENILKSLPYPEIVPAVLVPDDIPAVFCGFAQMVDILLLLKSQVLPAGNPVTHYLDIRKFVYKVLEIFSLLRLCPVPAGNRSRRQCRNSCHFQKIVHNFNVKSQDNACSIINNSMQSRKYTFSERKFLKNKETVSQNSFLFL